LSTVPPARAGVASAGPVTRTVSAIVDVRTLGAVRVRVLLIAGIVMMLDGYDIAAMGFVVPALATAWSMTPSAFGLALSGAIIGVACGSLVGGPLGDRFGRRTAIVGFFAFGGCAALATTAVTTMPELVAARIATGIGMGGVIPNAIALVSEYMPRSRRAFLTVLVYSAAGLGSVVGSLIAAWWVPDAGWQIVFWVGGVGPLLVALVAWRWLPESLNVMIRRGQQAAAIAVARAIDPALPAGFALVAEAPSPGATAPVRALFEGDRRYATALLWVLFVGTQALVFFFASWLTTLLTRSGYEFRDALYALSLFNVGSLIGGLLVAWQSDRRSPEWLLAGTYGTAVIVVLALAPATGPVAKIFALCALAGAAIVGASFCLGALAAAYYPSHARATGIGWGLAVGRAGSIT